MTELIFYALVKTPLEKFLPTLVQKIFKKDPEIWIVFNDKDRAFCFDHVLWTYTPISFLPHGCQDKDSRRQDHPIWLSTTLPDQTTTLILTEGVNFDLEKPKMKRLVVVFSKNSAQECLWAEKIYESFKESFDRLWEETEKGWKSGDPFFK